MARLDRFEERLDQIARAVDRHAAELGQEMTWPAQYLRAAPHGAKPRHSSVTPSGHSTVIRSMLAESPSPKSTREIVSTETLQPGPQGDVAGRCESEGEDGVFKAKVLTVNPKEITVKGQPKTIWYGFLADESGRTAYTAWKDFNLQPGLVDAAIADGRLEPGSAVAAVLLSGDMVLSATGTVTWVDGPRRTRCGDENDAIAPKASTAQAPRLPGKGCAFCGLPPT